jgi:hypothetical protein
MWEPKISTSHTAHDMYCEFISFHITNTELIKSEAIQQQNNEQHAYQCLCSECLLVLLQLDGAVSDSPLWMHIHKTAHCIFLPTCSSHLRNWSQGSVVKTTNDQCQTVRADSCTAGCVYSVIWSTKKYHICIRTQAGHIHKEAECKPSLPTPM